MGRSGRHAAPSVPFVFAPQIIQHLRLELVYNPVNEAEAAYLLGLYPHLSPRPDPTITFGECRLAVPHGAPAALVCPECQGSLDEPSEMCWSEWHRDAI